MRQGQQNRRGRGRGNNPNNGSSSSSNHHRKGGQNPLTRSYESNGPDIKIRGTAAHVAEKYMTLARDAHSSGDSVMAESYLQHAEHYNRLIMAYREQQMQPAEGMNGNGGMRPRVPGQEAEANEDNGEDDGEMSDPLSFGRFDSLPEQPMPQQQTPQQPPHQPEFRQQRHDRQGYSRPDRPQQDRQHDRPQQDRPQNDRPQHERHERQGRDQQPRRDYREPQRQFEAPRNDAPRDAAPRNDAGEPGPDAGHQRAYEPRRRPRPNPQPVAPAGQPQVETGEGFSQQPEFLTRPVRRRPTRERDPVDHGTQQSGEAGVRDANSSAEPNGGARDSDNGAPTPADKSTV